MTDTAKLTVSFTQKVSEAAYETADYTLSIERSVPESMGDDGIIAEATALFETVKTEVLRQAGCEVDFPDAQTCCGQPAFNSRAWGKRG